MPRRAGGGRISAPPARSFSSGPPRPAPSAVAAPSYRAAPPAPVHAPPSAMAPMGAQPRQPGLMAQMATTAAGVAVGSAVGHTIGHAMTGSGGGSQEAAPQATAPPAQQYQQQYQQQAQEGGPCAWEVKQFLECAQNQHDISLCQGFNEAIRQCKASNGLQA